MQYEENKAHRTSSPPSWPGVSRPSPSLFRKSKTWMPATSAGMTKKGHLSGNKKGPGRNRGPIDEDEKASRLFVGTLLERGAENVAQRRPRIGGAVLRDGLLLFGDFQRLDRALHLAGFLVELDHPRIDLLADGEAVGTLVVAVARQFRALDEGGEVSARDLDRDTAFLDLEHFAGHDRALLDVAGLGEGIAFELLDAERDALLLDIHIEHHGFHHVALLVIVDHLLARKLPVQVGQMHHAVDVALEP